MVLRLPVSLALAAIAVFCVAQKASRSPERDATDRWVSIAGVDGMGPPVIHAINVLRHRGIDAYSMGSLAYGIFVSKAAQARAKTILAEDAVMRPYEYISIAGCKSKLGFPDEKTWPVRKFNVDLDQIDTANEFKADANLRGMAREAATQTKSFGKRKGTLKEIRFFPMDYLDEQGKLQPAYKAVVTVEFQGGSSLTIWMYSWDQGRQHMSRGSVGRG